MPTSIEDSIVHNGGRKTRDGYEDDWGVDLGVVKKAQGKGSEQQAHGIFLVDVMLVMFFAIGEARMGKHDHKLSLSGDRFCVRFRLLRQLWFD